MRPGEALVWPHAVPTTTVYWPPNRLMTRVIMPLRKHSVRNHHQTYVHRLRMALETAADVRQEGI